MKTTQENYCDTNESAEGGILNVTISEEKEIAEHSGTDTLPNSSSLEVEECTVMSLSQP